MRTRNSPRFALSGIIALMAAAAVLSGTVGAGATQKPPQPAPAEAQVVAIEFRALLADSRPLDDLHVEDVELKVDGRPRTPQSLELVRVGGGQAAEAGADLPPPFATNTVARGRRDTVFVVEDESIAPSMAQAVHDAIRQFIDRLAPQDRIGVITIPRGGQNVGLTSDRAAIQSALSSLSGRAARSESDADAACRTRQVLDALTNMFRAAVGGPPVTIIMFGGGLTPPMVSSMSSMSGTSNLCEIRSEHFRDLERLILVAPVTVHVVQVPNLGGSTSTSQTAGLEDLAGVTGNRIVRLVGDSDAAMARIAAATSAYYRVTFVPEASEWNGQVHPVSLRVGRQDIEVRVRPGVFIPSARKAASSSKPPVPRDMLRVADAYRELALRAAAYVSREESGDRARVVVMTEPIEPGVSLKSAAVALYDDKGKLVVQATADQDSLARRPAMIATVARMGAYRLRVAAVDAAGRAGAVDTALDVTLTGDGPLKLSSLVLGVAEEGRFAGRLQFSDEPTAVAYLEIYGVAKGELAAELELADTETGPAAVRGAMRITGEPSDDQHVALGGIPIGPLPPGDIVVRAVVSLDGAPIGSVSRTLRKVKK